MSKGYRALSQKPGYEATMVHARPGLDLLLSNIQTSFLPEGRIKCALDLLALTYFLIHAWRQCTTRGICTVVCTLIVTNFQVKIPCMSWFLVNFRWGRTHMHSRNLWHATCNCIDFYCYQDLWVFLLIVVARMSECRHSSRVLAHYAGIILSIIVAIFLVRA